LRPTVAAAAILANMAPDKAAAALACMPPGDAANLLLAMDAADAALILAELPQEQVSHPSRMKRGFLA